jgi:hypothetical protein
MDSGPLVQANTPTVREMQPAGGGPWKIDRPPPRIYPELHAQESTLGEFVRVLVKRKRTVLACLFTHLFSGRHRQPQNDAGI